MVVTRGAQRALFLLAFTSIAAVYVFAWITPSIGLLHEDGAYLVTARAIAAGHGYAVESLPIPVPQTEFPPLFPALLALFSVVSMNAQWLKLLPLVCSMGWMVLTWRLLRKLGASRASAYFLVLVTAASPPIILLNTNLLPEALFGLLVSACLLVLINGKYPLAAGVLAGLATVSEVVGVTLIAAGIFTYLFRRRFPDAIRFTLGAVLFVALWFGWSAAQTNAALGSGSHSSLNMLSLGLAPGEKFRVLALNILFLVAAPNELITGTTNLIATTASGILLCWAILVRRQLVPDLFVLFYCLMLIARVEPPQRLLAPVLPLLIWLTWRSVQAKWPPEVVAAAIVVVVAAQVFLDFQRVPQTWRSGVFTAAGKPTDEWPEMQKLCGFIRTGTPQSSVLMANLDPLFFLQTGRHTVRGFTPNAYDLFYAATRRPAGAFQLLRSIRENQVDYVAVTPDRTLAEAPGFRAAVMALERDGVIEPVPVPDLAPEYRLWKVIGMR